MDKSSTNRMVVMAISGEPERFHMALMTATSAAAMGRYVMFFVSKSAIQCLTHAGSAASKITDYDKSLDDHNLADRPILWDALKSLPVQIVACESALVEYELAHIDLIDYTAIEVAGLATMIEWGSGGDFLSF